MVCECGFEAKSNAGLAAHKRNCKGADVQSENMVEHSDENVTVFNVVNSKGGFVRSYSVEVHGENAKELAEMFANKINGKICQD